MKRHFSFLHISDVHLSNQPSLLRTERELKESIIALTLKSLQEAVDFVISHNLDALFIAGDLFESERIDPETINSAFQILSLLDNIPVFIAPGNHDLFGNIYTRDRLKFYGITSPDNLIIFNTQDFDSVEIDGIKVFGCANLIPEHNPFLSKPEMNDKDINVALCHGSLLSFIPEGKELWLPFNEDDLLQAGFDYIALGHYHGYREITTKGGIIKAAYPGSLVPVTMKEKGDRGGLHVEITKEDNACTVRAEFVRLSQLKIEDININLTPDTSIKELSERLRKTLSSYQDSSQIIFNINLAGFGLPNMEMLYEDIDEYCLFARFNTENLSSININDMLSMYSKDSTIGMFLRRLLEEIENADEPEKRLIINALAYGLDALSGKQINPRYED